MTRRTITLSDRPPIIIEEDDWPLIARATTEGLFLGVRRHKDGRTIVYGTSQVSSKRIREGTLLCPIDSSTPKSQAILCQTIREVGRLLETDGVWLGDLISECIGSLPPEELD